MERSYESAIALVRPAVGPLAAHLSAFVASLIAKQYSINCVYIKGRHALAFDRWLATHGVTLADLSESDVARYNRRRSSRCRRSRRQRAGRSHLGNDAAVAQGDLGRPRAARAREL